MARMFYFKGKTLEELQKMTMDDFVRLIDSRARRQIQRAPVQYRKLLEKVKHANKMKKAIIETHFRSAVILPSWVGLKFGVHNGKQFVNVDITPEMVGRRLGEFSHTTGRVAHSGPGVGATRSSKFIPLK